MSKHAKYSPAMLSDVEECPCFTKQEEKEDEVNEAAEEGSMLHLVCETGDYTPIENDEQLHAVDNALAYVNEVVKSLAGSVEVRREVKLTLKGITYGTADVLALYKRAKTIHVFDYKFIRTSVSHAETNLQLHTYGAAALERFPSYKNVVVHIVAPRIGDYTRAEFTRRFPLSKGLNCFLYRRNSCQNQVFHLTKRQKCSS